MAVLADEVMVVTLAAKPVAGLPWMMAERIDGAAVAEGSQRAIDRGQADAVAAIGECSMDFLRGRVVPFGRKDIHHCQPLSRRTEARSPKELGPLRLRSGAHPPTIAH